MTGQEIFNAFAIIVPVLLGVYLAWSKLKQENKEKQSVIDEKETTSKRTERNGIIAEYEKVLKDQNARIDALTREVHETSARNKKEVEASRDQITELYEVIHKMQAVGLVKDEQLAQQAKKADKLQETILEAKDEVTAASVAAAKAEAEKVAAVTAAQVAVTAHPLASGKEMAEIVRDVLSSNVVEVKDNVEIIKGDVQDVKKKLSE